MAVNICSSQIGRNTSAKHLGITRNEKNKTDIDEKLNVGMATI